MAAAAVSSDATLVLLAGGRSTRFGRPKQLEPMGPNGEWIMELALRDAFALGWGRARIVARAEHAARIGERFARDPRVEMRIQHEAQGTAHAALVGMRGGDGTCIIANADDYYGHEALARAMAHALEGAPAEHALVSFQLAKTLSAHGAVNRAVCLGQGDGLAGLEEVRGLQRMTDGRIRDAAGRPHDDDAPVSMNLWVLRSSMAPLMEAQWSARGPAEPAEFGLPDAVRAALMAGQRFRLLRTDAPWCGLTFAEDAELVRAMLAQRP